MLQCAATLVLCVCSTMLELMKRREKSKKELVQLALEIVDKRWVLCIPSVTNVGISDIKFSWKCVENI